MSKSPESSPESPLIVFYDREMFGSDISFSNAKGGLIRSYKYALDNMLYSIQFFLGGTLSRTRSKLKDKDLKECIELYKTRPLNVYIHCAYINNLAGSIKLGSLVWDGNDEVDELMMESIKGIEYELYVTSQFGKHNGCVIHVGSWKDKEAGMKKIAQTINKINFPPNSTLLLENTAGAGTTIGKTFEELKYIYDLIDEDKKVHIKFCLDTCHSFCSGIVDFRKIKDVDKFFEDFDTLFGIEKLGLIHFNDSNYEYGTNRDNHAHIGKGYIWSEHPDSLKYIIEKIDELKIPLVLETHISDYDVIQSV